MIVVPESLLLVMPAPVTMIFNFVKRSSDSMQETNDKSVRFKTIKLDLSMKTYVLMMAKMNVPQGKLHVSSRLAVSPVTLLPPPFMMREGL